MSPKKLPYIDALRGVAILGVILWHCTSFGTNGYPDLFTKVIAEGARGVQLFYVLSAVTLCLSFQRRPTKEKHVLRNYYLRRFFPQSAITKLWCQTSNITSPF
jgi:peptidoglycan/LPS O-acetylase OafA/YrhL